MINRTHVIAIVMAALFATIVFFSLNTFGQISARVQPTGGYITGIVSSSGRAVPSVLVIISQDSFEKGRSLTGDDGRYYIGNLADGGYDLVAIKGHRQVIRRINLPKDQVTDINDF